MSREIDLQDERKLQNVAIPSAEKPTGLQPPKDFFVQRALDQMRTLSGELGLESTQPAEFAADHQFQRTTSGAVAVHLYQLYKNIQIFRATQTVVFAPNGSLQHTVGNSVPVSSDLEVSPRLDVTEAALIAARQMAQPEHENLRDQFGQSLKFTPIDVEKFKPRVLAVFHNLTERPSVLDNGELFQDLIRANLIWFPLSDGLRLSWEVVLTMPRHEGQFRTIVDAETGRVLYCAQLTSFVSARGNVFRTNGSGPREMVSFPLPLAEYDLPIPSDLPSGFPDDWVLGNDTGGNSVRAVLDSTGSSISGQLQNGAVVFNPADPSGDDQKVLNLFYYACYMHDFFYLLGFREKDGNFQLNDFNRGGIASDSLDARAAPGAVLATANMTTPPDGLSPVMNMGLVTDTQRHTTFDATVVFHEFMHGVTNRLVGGPLNNHALEAPQSKAMGEGWGDFIACTLNNTTVVAAWVVNRQGGIRGFPYDTNFPDHFGMLGTGRYTEIHAAGEIWCVALMEMTRRIPRQLTLQLVVDALKLSPATPNFLDMRNAILLALDHKLAAGQLTQESYDLALSGTWAAFAKFGMGNNARASGSSFSGNVADFTVPARLPTSPSTSPIRVQASPNLLIPDKDPVGIRSPLTFGQAGSIKGFKLSVDIRHPFVGDLRLSVVAPDGTTGLLQNVSQDSSQNLITSYTTENTPALSAFLGKQAQGVWTLEVADLTRLGVGTLRQWSLEIDLDGDAPPSATNQIHAEATPNMPIPDKDPIGVTTQVVIAASGLIATLTVSVDIVHEFVGDLQITLRSPDGRNVPLLTPSMDASQNLKRSFTPTDTPALAGLTGQPAQGNWSLNVADLVRLSVGSLRKWGLDITLS